MAQPSRERCKQHCILPPAPRHANRSDSVHLEVVETGRPRSRATPECRSVSLRFPGERRARGASPARRSREPNVEGWASVPTQGARRSWVPLALLKSRGRICAGRFDRECHGADSPPFARLSSRIRQRVSLRFCGLSRRMLRFARQVGRGLGRGQPRLRIRGGSQISSSSTDSYTRTARLTLDGSLPDHCGINRARRGRRRDGRSNPLHGRSIRPSTTLMPLRTTPAAA